jgi:putative alpha-1,2-mannosidase
MLNVMPNTRKRFSMILAAMALIGGMVKSAVANEADVVRWVNPFIGTSATGHTFPAACVPFGIL